MRAFYLLNSIFFHRVRSGWRCTHDTARRIEFNSCSKSKNCARTKEGHVYATIKLRRFTFHSALETTEKKICRGENWMSRLTRSAHDTVESHRNQMKIRNRRFNHILQCNLPFDTSFLWNHLLIFTLSFVGFRFFCANQFSVDLQWFGQMTPKLWINWSFRMNFRRLSVDRIATTKTNGRRWEKSRRKLAIMKKWECILLRVESFSFHCRLLLELHLQKMRRKLTHTHIHLGALNLLSASISFTFYYFLCLYVAI